MTTFRRFRAIYGWLCGVILLATSTVIQGAVVEGRLTTWHPITLTFQGPEAAETDNLPNPFSDVRLQVVFTGPSQQRFVVPGFFDGDGQGGPKGRTWRCSLFARGSRNLAV